jgi:putative DNA primase/helicase
VSAAERIARALGGSGRARDGWCSCACPVCQGEGKLGLKDTTTGLAVNCFRLCRRADILAALDSRGLLSNGQVDPEDSAITARQDAKEALRRRQKIAEARDFISSECFPWNATGQIARYLRGRGIDTSLLTTSLMFHGMSWHREGGQRPVMVGVVEHAEHGIIGASKTYLAIDGSEKAAFRDPRLFVGIVGGGAVRLGSPDNGRELVVGEGIESTLSYMQMHGLPGWATLSAGGIARLVLPPEAKRVVIAGDNDRNGASLKGALAAARRWGGEMRRVRIDLPPDVGTDWNNVLTGRSGVAA